MMTTRNFEYGSQIFLAKITIEVIKAKKAMSQNMILLNDKVIISL
jgi:hypothetical protein